MSCDDHRLFVEVVELLKGLPTSTDPTDKRRAPRVEMHLPADIKLAADPDAPWMSAQMRDLSTCGVRLHVDRPIAADDSFLLRLPTRKGGKSPVPLICRAVYCIPHNLYIIGAEFTGYAAPDQAVGESAYQLERARRSIVG
jgi:hypothetical protein